MTMRHARLSPDVPNDVVAVIDAPVWATRVEWQFGSAGNRKAGGGAGSRTFGATKTNCSRNATLQYAPSATHQHVLDLGALNWTVVHINCGHSVATDRKRA